MKVFVSWSGGKDCMLALHRIKKEGMHDIHCLVNMCDKATPRSRSHGISNRLIGEQAFAMGIPVIQPVSGFDDYELVFKSAINQLKAQGVKGGVFGDIYLQEHRDWIERVCAETEIEPIFPLWGNSTADLLQEFVNEGFKARLVAVNQQHLTQNWLGRNIDQQFVNDILELPGLDPCAENGEYHSFVFDGPAFVTPVVFQERTSYVAHNHWFLELE